MHCSFAVRLGKLKVKFFNFQPAKKIYVLKLATFERLDQVLRKTVGEGSTVQYTCFRSLPNSSKQQSGAPVKTLQQYSTQSRVVHLWRYRATSRERNFIKWTKAPIFSEVDLVMETI